jgi:hypothetical protein
MKRELILLVLSIACAGCLWAQAEETELVKKPETRDETHIMGIVPDYETVRNSSGVILPISTRTKYWLATEDVFDPFTFAITGVYAAGAQMGNQYPEFGQGAKGYAKRYTGAFADGAIGNYMTEAVFPSLLHQDPRYFRMGNSAGFWKRVGYSMSRTIVTRSDAGKRQFNYSEIIGTSVATGISAAYYPSSYRHADELAEKLALSVGSDAGFNILKEFWPDMRHKFFGK